MARNEWYTDNANRRYPFAVEPPAAALSTPANTLPNSALVDCGVVCLHGGGFVPGRDRVWVSDVATSPTHVQLTLSSNAPGIADTIENPGGNPLIFDIPRTAPENTPVFGSCEIAGPGSCPEYLLWHGFVVVGRISELAGWAENVRSGPLLASAHLLEPHCVQSLQGAYVRSLSIANRRRTRTTDIPGVARDIVPIATCRQGAQRFVAGYNCVIGYDTAQNGLVFAARRGEGAGEPCGEVPAYDGEEPVPDSALLSGGPACRDTIRSINGAPGPALRLRGENGITVRRHPDEPGRIIVRLDPTTLAR